MSRRGPLAVAVALVAFALCLFPATSATRVLSYGASDLIRLELVPHDLPVLATCVLGNCTEDAVFNLMLPGGDQPGCWLREHLPTSEPSGIFSVTPGETQDMLEVSIAALLEVIFTAGDKCVETLSAMVEDLACNIAQNYVVDDFEPIVIRIVEEAAMREPLFAGCAPQQCSGCIEEVPVVCFGGLDPKQLDLILRRHELQNARRTVRDILARLVAQKAAVRDRLQQFPTRDPQDLSPFLQAQQHLHAQCLPSWDKALFPVYDR